MRGDFAFGGVELGHFGDELVDEDVDAGEGVLDAVVEVGVDEEGGDGDDEAGDGGEQGGGDAGGDGVDVDFAALGDDGEGDHDADDGA